MVEGGGFEPPKLTRQIYNLIPLATREPLQNQGANIEAYEPLCQPFKQINLLLFSLLLAIIPKPFKNLCNLLRSMLYLNID